MAIDIDDYGLVQEEAVTGEKRRPSTLGRCRSRAPRAPTTSRTTRGDEGQRLTGFEDHRAASIPDILATLRDLGRRGMEVKRFKGLGEMDPERTLGDHDGLRERMMRVTWDQGEAADDLFTTLMGENVEQRNYIERHALEVKQLDV